MITVGLVLLLLKLSWIYPLYQTMKLWFALMSDAEKKLTSLWAKVGFVVAKISTWVLSSFCLLVGMLLLIRDFLISAEMSSAILAGATWFGHQDHTVSLAVIVFVFSMLGTLVARRLTD